MIALKRVLVPYDFGETSTTAVRYAVGLCRTFSADLVFLYVGDRQKAELDRDIPVDADGAVSSESVRSSLLKVLSPADFAALNPQFFVRPGLPAAEIVKLAEEQAIDLIVMGTHGRGFVGHMVMGSVAEKVVRTAPCPVLTVRNPSLSVQGMGVLADAATATRAAV